MDNSEYTGHVEPGGDSAVRTFSALEIRKVSVGPMDNNAYLLTCRRTGEQVLIDAAAEPDRLLELVAEGAGETASTTQGPRLQAIITTHSHHDHVGALEALVETTGAATIAGAADAPAISVPTSVPVEHGASLQVGEQRLEVIALRGHTPGSIAVLWRGGEAGDHLFTGDSLFPGGVGNTDRDPQRFAQLLEDVEQRLFGPLPDQTWVYPGHGDDTTLGAERPSLPAWRERGW